MTSRVNAVLTANWAAMAGRGQSLSGSADGEQLVFPLPVVRLTEDVGIAGRHAVAWMPATRERLGLEDFPLRAFCGVRVADTAGGTTDPSRIACRRCLRALRAAGLLS